MTWMAMPIFDHTHPRIIEITFSFPEFAPVCKKEVHSINSFLRYSQFKSPMTRLATPISNHAHSKDFWLTFSLSEFVSTCKKSGYFIDLFWRYGWLKKSCNPIGRGHFDPYLRNKNFFQIGDLCRNTANNISFHFRTNSVKINDQIFQ